MGRPVVTTMTSRWVNGSQNWHAMVLLLLLLKCCSVPGIHHLS